MKVQIYSQWMEDVYIPVRVKQFTKAAKLSGHASFIEYAAEHDAIGLALANAKATEREAVVEWLDSRGAELVAESVA